MNKKILCVTLCLLGCLDPIFGQIPSVPSLLEQVIRGRSASFAKEISFRHSVDLQNGRSVQVEETVLLGNRQVYLSWVAKSSSYYTLKARLRGNVYDFPGKKKIQMRSTMFLKNFLASKPEELKNTLLKENFVRATQLQTFKSGFTPEGNPKNWDVKENYVQHDDIYLKRLPSGVSIAVVGLDAGLDGRAVFFRKDGRAIVRLEWKESGQVVAWNFNDVQRQLRGAYYPKKLGFEIRGREVIRSTVRHVKSLSRKQFSSALKRWETVRSSSSVPDEVQSGFQILLSYR